MSTLKVGEVKVLLAKNTIPISNCKPVYIGMLGMCLETGSLTLQKHDLLDVEIYLQRQNQRRRCQLQAVVTQSSRSRTGLTFVEVTEKNYLELQEIVVSNPIKKNSAQSN